MPGLPDVEAPPGTPGAAPSEPAAPSDSTPSGATPSGATPSGATPSAATPRPRFWHVQPGAAIGWDVDEPLISGRTEWQEYRFWRSEQFGVCTAIDGDLQSTEIDCPTYHEALVHPAMLLHPSPRKVLILGGGEGATAREVLRHETVDSVVMVDIDERFVDLCRREMPQFSAGAFDDPRLTVRYDDALEPSARSGGPYDVIIGDLTDEIAEIAPGKSFHGAPFYGELGRELAPEGYLVTQASALGLFDYETHRYIRGQIRTVFEAAYSYRAMIDSFFEAWSFVVAGRPLPLPELGTLEALFGQRMRDRGIGLEHFDAPSLAACFRLDKRIRRRLA